MKRLARRRKKRRGIVSGNGGRGLTTDPRKARYLAVRAIRFACNLINLIKSKRLVTERRARDGESRKRNAREWPVALVTDW